MIVIITGVSGAGKTTVGRLLAANLGWEFFEGDDYHPEANIAKMTVGVPLSDADRQPWLDRLEQLIRQLLREGRSGVLTCSGLKARYRAQLQVDPIRVSVVLLKPRWGADKVLGSESANRNYIVQLAISECLQQLLLVYLRRESYGVH